MEPIEWRPIFDGVFAISSDGRIQRLLAPNSRTTPRELKPFFDKKTGYFRIGIFVNGKRSIRTIHSLVLTAFKGECPPRCEGSHLNGIRTDNRVENLIWETRKDNHARKTQHGTRQSGMKNGATKLTDEDVLEIRRLYDSGARRIDIAARFRIHRATVHNIGTRRLWNQIPETDAAHKRLTGEAK